jgi:hypothetical protein
MIAAFTGPSKLTREQELTVVKELDIVSDKYDVWRSGCAFGVDTIVAHQADLDGRKIELYVPAAGHNEALIDELEHERQIIECPAGLNPYRVRNETMVGGWTRGTLLHYPKADLLVAFLKSATFYRSGEWMTVNIAKRLGVPIVQIVI